MSVDRRRTLPIALALPLLLGTMTLPASAATVVADPRPPTAPTVGAAPSAVAPAGASPSSDLAEPTVDLQPSIHWEEAQAHAADNLDLPAGGRVTVGFTPRSDDHWEVGGERPSALPAGTSSGRVLRAAAHIGPDGQVVEPAQGIDATATSVSATTSSGEISLQAKVSASGLRKEIFGFLPYWELTDSSTTLDYGKLSTIAYFGVGAAADGSLERTTSSGSPTVGWTGWTSAQLTNVIDDAHRTHTRVVLTVQSFAWTSSGAAKQRALLGSATARANLARQIAGTIRARGADGVNLDFEPIATGYADEFTALVRRVRTELDRVHSGYQLTFDTTGYIGNYPIEAATAAGGADAIFVMGYDYRTSGSSPVGSIAPIGGPRYDITDTIRAYTARVPASKVILGVPYYGRAWSTSSGSLNAANTSSAATGGSTAVVYGTAIGVLQDHGRHYDTREGVAWTAYQRQNCTSTYGCVTSWRQLYLDDATALKAKYDLVNGYRLRGAGIWALGYDGTRPELWAAIKTKFVTDTTPPRSWITRLASSQTSPGFVVRWGGDDDSGIASYDLQVSRDGGPWSAWLSKTTVTAALYPGSDGHRYSFRVRARDIKRNVGTWAAVPASFPGTDLRVGGFGAVRVDGLAVRTSPSTSAPQLGVVNSGSLVAITGGPVSAGGSTWYRIAGALRDWPASTTTHTDAWLAASTAGVDAVTPAPGPHQTRVAGQLTGLTFGDTGTRSVGPSTTARKHRSFSPNGDGRYDTIKLRWTNGADLDALELRVYRADGSAVGVVPLPPRNAGTRVWGWDGRVGGARLPVGTYYVTLVGTIGAATHANPSVGFGGSVLLGRFGVRIANRLIPFSDVTSFVPAIEWLYMEDITGGCSPTRFCPDARVTRVQMAQFLARALHLTATTTDAFDDDDGRTGEGAINAMARAGLTGGCGPRRFCPDAIVTRARLAQFLVRALRLPPSTTDFFDDDDGLSGEGAINALARAGLTTGCSPRRFCPSKPVTREQMAALLYRSLGH